MKNQKENMWPFNFYRLNSCEHKHPKIIQNIEGTHEKNH